MFDEDDNDNSKVNSLHFRLYCDLQNIFTHRDSTSFHRERRVAFPMYLQVISIGNPHPGKSLFHWF